MKILYCPPDVETATDVFDPAGYDENDCAGCGCPREEHHEESDEDEFERQSWKLLSECVQCL